MKLFESAWQEDWEFYERVLNTETNKSEKRKIDKQHEFFVPKTTGLYRYMLDDTVKLDKQYGSSKVGRDKFGLSSPIEHHIRDEYWNEDSSKALYNTNPRIWYIDIETRVGLSYKYPTTNKKVKIRIENKEQETTVDKLREIFYDNSKYKSFEYFNEIENKWESLQLARFMERNSGFPVPEKALEEISMFQILDNTDNIMYLFGTKDWKYQDLYLKYGDSAKFLKEHQQESELPFEVKYVNCGNEISLIKTFMKLIKDKDPLILLAWNGSGFDYPYIHNRVKNLGLDVNELSNYGNVSYSEREFKGLKEFKVDVKGHYWLDLKDIYKKFVFKNHSNYSLNTISYETLGDTKVQHSEYSKFDDFYTGVYNRPTNPTDEQLKMQIYHDSLEGKDTTDLSHSEFVWYGLKDTWLLKRINERMKLTDVMIDMIKRTGTQLPDTLGTVRMWGQYLSNLLMQKNMVLPIRTEFEQPNVVGGFVKDPQVGKHSWVMSIDVNSMYPLLGMVSFNMSPETYVGIDKLPNDLRDIVLTYYNDQDEGRLLGMDDNIKQRMSEKLKEHNLSLGVTGACFKQDFVGIIPKIIKDIYLERKQKKKDMFKYEQMRINIEKILEELN